MFSLTYQGKYYKASHDITANSNGNVSGPSGTSSAITSTLTESVSKVSTLINNPWQYNFAFTPLRLKIHKAVFL